MDFDFGASSGFIYWMDRQHRLYIRRIKPDGSDYADIVAIPLVQQSRHISALAINWVEGMT